MEILPLNVIDPSNIFPVLYFGPVSTSFWWLFLFWTLVYFILKAFWQSIPIIKNQAKQLNQSRSAKGLPGIVEDLANRSISSIHALITMFYGIDLMVSVLVNDYSPVFYRPVYANFVHAIVLSYFAFDFLWMITNNQIYGLENSSVLIHHVFSAWMHYLSYTTSCCWYWVIGYMAMETTNPLMNLKSWLESFHLENSTFYHFNMTLIIVLWIVTRVLIAIPGYYGIYIRDYSSVMKIPLASRLTLLSGFWIMTLLNCVWFYQITKQYFSRIKITKTD